jgi:hypothetical protein
MEEGKWQWQWRTLLLDLILPSGSVVHHTGEGHPQQLQNHRDKSGHDHRRETGSRSRS